MSEISGLVFNIQRFSLHDGPGIRTTVFLNGCPLHCPWCCNPESNSGKAELFYNPQRCIGCNICAEICKQKAIHSEVYSEKRIDRILCTCCGLCAKTCPSMALSTKGKPMTVKEVIDIVLRDKPFYNSGGGVTFSGGEPFMQPEFLLALLKHAKQHGLNTAVETSGCVAWRHIQSAMPYLDMIIYDFKHPDSETHQKLTGVGNELICDNLAKLVAQGINLLVRIPLIPDFNSNEETLRKSAGILKGMGIRTIEFLHYHTLGTSKFTFLGRNYGYVSDDDGKEERAKLAVGIFEEMGIEAILDA